MWTLKKKRASARKSARRARALNPQKINLTAQLYRKANPEKTKFAEYKSMAKHRNHIFELSFEELVKLLKGNCKYCGKKKAFGVDRVNNNLGYTVKNSVSCCYKCNHMKGKLTFKQFINHITKIKNHGI